MLASILQNQTAHATQKTHPKDLTNSPPRPASDMETKDTVQRQKGQICRK
jgi:hypothetical protein